LSEATFGERLAEARRRKGETIEEVSEQLRIRPSIIQALETDNFGHMPHKGYSRNMVSSYARYLGLNSTTITEQFLVEFHRYESLGMPRKFGSPYKPDNSLEAITTTQIDANGKVRKQIPLRGQRETITAAKRNQARSSYWGQEDKAGLERDFQDHIKQAHIDKDDSLIRMTRRAPGSVHKRVRTNDYVGKPPNGSLIGGIFSNLTSRPVLLIGGLVVLFLVILIAWATLASSCSKNETTNIPVTGVSSSDKGLDDPVVGSSLPDIEAQMAEENKYGPFELTIEIVNGPSWLLVSVDGTATVGDVLEPPWSAKYTVNTLASIEAAAPGNVKVYRNGVEVSLQVTDGLGVLELAVEQRPITQNAQNAQNAQTANSQSAADNPTSSA
jgi:transcriptional regulator with XRE-family HTH domain